ncbi:MAG: hypothetical protein PHS53_02360 [Candidatus Pacebacteria bacterium]|nr:hypothetical protein [Candidatus Paceibacterota bacterium]MDD5356969.1 hypothetical protein [Candidatus Paceibacterota bacterium]
MILDTWRTVLSQSFVDLWLGVVNYVPNLVVAIVIFAVGWFLGSFIGRVIEQIFKSIKLDNALRSAGVEEVIERGGMKLNSGAFIGGLVKWFIILAFLVASFDALHLDRATEFLRYVVLIKIPQVIVAVLILMVAVVIAEAIHKIVVVSAKAAGLHSAALVGSAAKWAIWVFAVIVALSQVGIADDFLLTFFQGVIVAISVALGLAFGLGGQDAAAKYIEKVRGEISHRG